MIARLIRRLYGDERASTIVEFGLLAPALFAMLFGVLQIGLGMQAYNALRAIAGDTARHAVTSYQINTNPSMTILESYGRTVATKSPYGLQSENLTLRVTQAAVQRVDGARELRFHIRYNVPSILTVIGIEHIPIAYTRPIFVIDPDS